MTDVIDALRPASGLIDGPDARRLVAAAGALYVLGLWGALLVGPVVLTVATDLSLGSAIVRVVATVGVAYLLGIAVLLR